MKGEAIRSSGALGLKAILQKSQGLRLSLSLLQRTHCELVPVCVRTWVVTQAPHWQKSIAVISMKGTLKLYGFSLPWLVTFNIQGKTLVLASGLENWIGNQKDINPKAINWPLLEKHNLESVTNDSFVFICLYL